MGDQVIPQVTPPTADPTVTPPAPVTPPIPDPAEEQRRENETLKKQLADKDRFITEIKSEKETLEARLTQTQPKPTAPVVDTDLQKEAARILEIAQLDPAKAGEELGRLIQTATSKAAQETLRNLEPLISQNTYINEVKEKNKDLIDLGLEPAITIRASQLIQSGKSFKDAVDAAVSESRIKMDKLKSNTPTVPPTPPPPGAVGEGGANRQPEPTPPPKEETPEDEIRAAQERRRKMGL